MHDWNWPSWGMSIMWLIWVPLIILAVLLINKLNTTNQFSKKESPLEILKRRYANGEITAEEYEQRKKVLGK